MKIGVLHYDKTGINTLYCKYAIDDQYEPNNILKFKLCGTWIAYFTDFENLLYLLTSLLSQLICME